MCGITGKIRFRGAGDIKADIERMNRAIAHRGPDGQGVYASSDRNIGLGHARLAVIDTSARGAQPMSYLDRYYIVFNGEMYNFQQERTRLKKAGYQFKSDTDTEVVLALYDAHKQNCLDRMEGMFAFAIYDSTAGTLFCARDRLGKKPFKYIHTPGAFVFASELKALLTQLEHSPAPDSTALYHYLTLQYVPAPQTGFQNIQKLEPGHYLLVDTRTGTITKKRYWQLDFRNKHVKSIDEWQQVIVSGLERAVRKRLVADVPIGAFLSGGIDSSAVVACMAKFSDSPVRTFSIGFPSKRYNELPYARVVAKQFKTDHTEFVVQPTDIEILPTIARHFEEPFADSSALPMWYLAQQAKQRITVALSGDGGDESFAGYPKYSALAFASMYERARPLHRTFVRPLADRFAGHVRGQLMERAVRFARTMSMDYAHRMPAYTSFFTEEQKDLFLSTSFATRTRSLNTYSAIAQKLYDAPAHHTLERAMYADITSWLPDDLLVKVDIASMAFGLEVRSPFLDHDFMQSVTYIPPHLKLRRITDRKHILKIALKNYLPVNIINRPKRGFSIPLSAWLRGDLHQYAASQLLAPEARIHEFLRRDALADLLRAHARSQQNYAHHIWAALMLELWLQEYF